jgi:hypothetical protein
MLTPLTVAPAPQPLHFVRTGFKRPLGATSNNFEARKSGRKLRVDFICRQSNPEPMAKTKKPKHDPQWAKAKNVCCLNMEDIRMAKELGISPGSLMKNRPSPSQPWKQPVKEWIHELYEKRFGRKASVSNDHNQLNASSQPETPIPLVK